MLPPRVLVRQSSRQVAIAIAVGFVRGVRTHVETVQAVFTAFSALSVGFGFIREPLLRLVRARGQERADASSTWNDIFMVTTSIVWFAIAIATGMLIARLHPARQATMTFAILTFRAAFHLPEWYRLAMNSLETSRLALSPEQRRHVPDHGHRHLDGRS